MAYTVQMKNNFIPQRAREGLHFFWKQRLLDHDSRYNDFCGGYYPYSIADSPKTTTVLDFLDEYDVPKNGKIVDVGCGVGPFLLLGRLVGYTDIIGVEANPRWLIAGRMLYEATFNEPPHLMLVPRGSFTLPQKPDLFDAIILLGVYIASGNDVPFEAGLTEAYGRLKKGGLLCFDVTPTTYGETTVEPILKLLAELGFKSLRCRPFKSNFFLTGCKN